MLKKLISSACLLAVSHMAQAETRDLGYHRFYSHIQKLASEDTQALQFAFGFARPGQSQLCKITAASITTSGQTSPLKVSEEFRFTVPSEQPQELADAVVRIALAENSADCAMSVQLETRPEYLKQHYSADELSMLTEQYTAFFNNMGSFSSFKMPAVSGLAIQFADAGLSMPIKNAPPVQAGMLRLPNAWLEQQNKPLSLPGIPLRITAITSRY